MTTNKKRISQRYWDSLSEESRYRALRKVFSNFSDSTNHDYAKEKARNLDWVWGMIQRHVKQPTLPSEYKTVIDRTWIP